MDDLKKVIPTSIEGDGGSPSKPHRPVEYSDTLRSKQSLKMLWAVGEGEIESVDTIYADDVDVDSLDALVDVRLGTQTQDIIPGFVDVETPFGVGVTLTSGNYNTHPVSTFAVDAVRVTLQLPILRKQKSNGDLVGSTVSFTIETRENASGSWSVAALITKTGKASNPYVWDTLIAKPGIATDTDVWEFRVVRSTADSNSSKLQNSSVFIAYTEIQYDQLSYPNTALVGVTFNDVEQIGGKIPKMSFDGVGRKVKIPSSAYYDPTVFPPAYPLVWDGSTFALSNYASSNPAWVLYDLLTDTRVGLGISIGRLDVMSFYNLAKYCDESVSDGVGGQELRFKIDKQFFRRETASVFLNYVLALCNSKLITALGLITIVVDRPTSATKLVTNSNVINGDFSYASSEISTRFNSVNVSYNNKDDNHNVTTITETNPLLITKYGTISTDIVLAGCTSESQARRKALWMIETNAISPNTISFVVGLQGLVYQMGEVIEVMDEEYSITNQQALVSSILTTTTSVITLDRTITLNPEIYSVMVYGSDGVTIETATIIETNTTTNTLTTLSSLASDPISGSVIVIKGDVIPQPFKVVSITESGDDFTVNAVQYDEAKFGRIDGGVTVTPPGNAFVNIDEFSTEAVENIVFEEAFVNTGTTQTASINVSWDWDVDESEKYGVSYHALWRRDSGEYSVVNSIGTKGFDINEAIPGTYDVTIYAYNVRGIRSAGVNATYNYRTVSGQSTLIAPTNLQVALIGGVTYNTPDLNLEWAYPASNDDKTDTFLDYVLEVWSSDGLTLKRTEVVPGHATTKNGAYTYKYGDNRSDFGDPTRDVQIKVYSRDTIGDLSAAIAVNFVNPVPGVVSFNIISGIGMSHIDLTPPVDDDMAGYVIYRDTVSLFTPGVGNLVYDGPDNYVSLAGSEGTTYYYVIAAYDTFGKTGLSLSGETSSTTLSVDIETFTFTGLTFEPNDPSANSVSWTTGTANVSSGGTITSYSITAGNAAWTTGELYIYYTKTNTALSTTTDFTVAMATGNRVLQVYKGGTDLKGATGDVFIDGDKIIAGTVGANQLVVGSAVITGSTQLADAIINSVHINDGQITNAKIGNTIQSTSWNPTTKTGWNLDKSGIISATGINIYDGAGNVVFGSGTSNQLDWANVNGANQPDDNADVTSSNTSNNTSNVGSSTAVDVSTSVNNFDARNDRNGTAIVTPTILTNGTAIDHTINTDGSADISFEWSWAGTESDIDGFFVGIRSSTSASAYTFGTTSSEETIVQVPSDRRAHGFTGVPSDKHNTFFVRAYRVVDNDINSNNIILSAAVQPSLALEAPYQANANVAFAGNLTGTIQGSAAGSLANKSSVDLASGDVTNKSLANVDSLQDTKLNGISPGADVTSYTDSRVANDKVDNSILTVVRPIGGTFSGSATNTGVIKITLPQSWTNTMMSFIVDVYNYSSGKSFSLQVGGYNHSTSTSWINTTANIMGNTTADNRVRFGHDGTKCAIYIGETTTTWNYIKISVRDFSAGFSGHTVANWDDNWVVSIPNTVGTITSDIADALIDAAVVKDQGALATKNTVDLSSGEVTNKSLANVDSSQNTKLNGIDAGADVTSANTAANISGQGALATKSSVDLATTDVSNKSLANVDSSQDTKLNGIATGADVTSANTAANISGQGSFATLSQITSGNITTYMANAAIQTAQIAYLSVGTLHLQDQSVTIPSSAFTAAALNPPSLGTWYTIQSLTITTTGNPIIINAGAVGTSVFVNARLKEDGVVIIDQSAFYGACMFATKRTPSVGSHTYLLEGWEHTAGSFGDSLANRSIVALEVKK